MAHPVGGTSLNLRAKGAVSWLAPPTICRPVALDASRHLDFRPIILWSTLFRPMKLDAGVGAHLRHLSPTHANRRPRYSSALPPNRARVIRGSGWEVYVAEALNEFELFHHSLSL